MNELPGSIERQASCEDASETDLLPVDVARDRIIKSLQPCVESECIEIDQALHRVLAQEITSTINVPAAMNSAMDGYAINSRSIPAKGVRALSMVGTAWAGQPYTNAVKAGEAVRIFTGAIMPEGTDTVVIQEHAQASDNVVTIDADVIAGRNVRMAGEDIRYGQTVFNAGHRLEAAEIGVLASLGISQVNVVRPLRVAFFTTGDELVALEQHIPGTELAPGKLFDSNRYTLGSLLTHPAIEPVNLGVVKDDEAATRDALLQASSTADLIVTSGGVSAGDADFVTRVFHEIGNVSFWKIAMRPGRPLVFGSVGDAAFFGLPGNPVAVMVTYLTFVQPAIHYLCGMPAEEPVTVPAICDTPLRKSAGRIEYQRGIMTLGTDGQLHVSSTGKQGAGRLSSMSRANCLIVIEAERSSVTPGESVHVQPFHGLLSR